MRGGCVRSGRGQAATAGVSSPLVLLGAGAPPVVVVVVGGRPMLLIVWPL